MSETPPKLWLRDDKGGRIPIPPQGLSLGRSARNDLISTDMRASGRHALIICAMDQAMVIPIGRNPTTLNREAVSVPKDLVPGDVVEIPGLAVTLEGEGEVPLRRRPRWSIFTQRGGLYGLTHSPFAVGGGPEDDCSLPSLPPRAAIFQLVGGTLLLELKMPGRVGGVPSPEGYFDAIYPGETLEIGEERLTVQAGRRENGKSTLEIQALGLPEEVELAFLPEGGQIRVMVHGEMISVDLADLRCRLLAAILKPPGGYDVGDFVPDDVLIAQIWPGQRDKGRTDVNLLLYRIRKQLVKAGISGHLLLERSPLGNGTRFLVGLGAKVTVG